MDERGSGGSKITSANVLEDGGEGHGVQGEVTATGDMGVRVRVARMRVKVPVDSVSNTWVRAFAETGRRRAQDL